MNPSGVPETSTEGGLSSSPWKFLCNSLWKSSHLGFCKDPVGVHFSHEGSAPRSHSGGLCWIQGASQTHNPSWTEALIPPAAGALPALVGSQVSLGMALG